MTKKLFNIIFCLFLVISMIAGLSGCCNLANLGEAQNLSEKPGGYFDVYTFTAPDGTAFKFDLLTCVGGKLDKGLNTLEVTDYFVYSTKGDELMLYPLSLSPVMTIDWASPRTFKTKGSPIKYFDEYQPFDGNCEIKFPSEREKDMFDEAAFFGWDAAFNARSETVTPPSFVATAINRNTGPKVPNTVIQKEQYYARSTLTDSEKAVYDIVYDTIFEMKDKTPNISKYKITDERASDIIHFIYCDAPELYWWNSSRITNTNGQVVSYIQFQGEDFSAYEYTEDEKKQIQGSIDVTADKILNNVNDQMSEYEKVKYIFTELGKIITYDQEAADAVSSGVSTTDNTSQNIVGGLVKSKAVCAGISRSLQYLLYNVGIPCYYVSGTKFDIMGGTDPGRHGWNMALIDGDWYYMDLTVCLDSIKREPLKDFLETEELILLSASFTSLGDLEDKTDDKNENPPLPECNSERFNYANIEGAIFDSFDSNTLNSIKNYLADALLNRKNQIESIFTSSEAAETAEKVFNGSDISGKYPTPHQIAADIAPKDGLAIFTTSASFYKYNPDYNELTIHLLYQKIE